MSGLSEVVSISRDSCGVTRTTSSEKAFDPIVGMKQRMMLRTATIAHVQTPRLLLSSSNPKSSLSRALRRCAPPT
jgi:hypothetical protein